MVMGSPIPLGMEYLGPPKQWEIRKYPPKLMTILHMRTRYSIYHDKIGWKKQPYIFHLLTCIQGELSSIFSILRAQKGSKMVKIITYLSFTE